MQQLDRTTYSNLKEIGSKARALILAAAMPEELAPPILLAYKELCGGSPLAVAVRSSATARICHRQVLRDSMSLI